MPRRPAATLTFDASQITNARQLESAIAIAGHSDNAGASARATLEIRAKQLNREDLIPKSWSTPARPATRRTTTPARPAQTTLLDESPAALMAPERRADLDHLIRAMTVELDIDAPTALDSLIAETVAGRELMRATPQTIRDVLRAAGIKDPEVLEGEVRMLATRDHQVMRTLDTATAPLAEQRVDAQGRVLLPDGFDVAGLLHNDLERERRWRTARTWDNSYGDRASFDLDDQLMLESGCDLVETLARPKAIANARQRAAQVGEHIDGIVESGREPAAKLRELDSAISTLSDQRSRLAPKAPDSQPVKTLDRPELDAPARFVDLDAAGMGEALTLYDSGRRGLSLDAAAAQIAGGIPEAKTPLDADFGPMVRTDFQAGRQELHEKVQAYMAQHPGVSYLESLGRLTNSGPVFWPDAPNPAGR